MSERARPQLRNQDGGSWAIFGCAAQRSGAYHVKLKPPRVLLAGALTRAPRRTAQFIDDVETFMQGKEVDTTIKSLQDAYTQYRMREVRSSLRDSRRSRRCG